MTIQLAQIGATTKQAVTDTAGSWLDPAQPALTNGFATAWRGRYIVSSDVVT